MAKQPTTTEKPHVKAESRLAPKPDEIEILQESAFFPLQEEIRYGQWVIYSPGLVRLTVLGHTKAEAIQNYKNALNLRRTDLPMDAKRID